MLDYAKVKALWDSIGKWTRIDLVSLDVWLFPTDLRSSTDVPALCPASPMTLGTEAELRLGTRLEY